MVLKIGASLIDDIEFAPGSLRTDQDSEGGEGRHCPSPSIGSATHP
jgi:hypothetical protein